MPIICQLLVLSLLPLLTFRSPDALFSYGVSVSSFRHQRLGLNLHPDLEREDDVDNSPRPASFSQNDNYEEPYLLESLYESVNLNPGEQPFQSNRVIPQQEDPVFNALLDRDNNDESEVQDNLQELPTDTELQVDHEILKALEDILGTLKNKDRVSSPRAPSYRREIEEDYSIGNNIDKNIGNNINSESGRESEVNFWDKIQEKYPDVKLGRSSSSFREVEREDNDQPTHHDDYSVFLNSLTNGQEEHPILLENLYKSGKLDPDQPDLLMNYLLSTEDDHSPSRVMNRRLTVDVPQVKVLESSSVDDKLIDDEGLDSVLYPRTPNAVIDPGNWNSLRKRQSSIRKTSQHNPLDQLVQEMLSSTDVGNNNNDDDDDISRSLILGDKVSSSLKGLRDQIKPRAYFAWTDDLERSEPILPQAWKSRLENKASKMQLESPSKLDMKIDRKIDRKLDRKFDRKLDKKLAVSEADGVTGSEDLSKRTDVKKPGPRFMLVSLLFILLSTLFENNQQ